MILIFHQIILYVSNKSVRRNTKTLRFKQICKKLQYDTNREGVKISALLSVKIDEHGHLTFENKLSSDQIRMIEEAKFTYCPLEKFLEKQITIEKQASEKANKSN